MKRSFLFPALILMSAFPLTAAHAADATSFNPTTVKVTAKPISSIPVGTIISWPVAQNPADWQNPDGSYNWLECNGQTISQTAYPELVALLGGRVPDLRGLFLRGYGSQSHAQNNGSTVGVTSTTHASGALGQVQGDAARRTFGSFPSVYLWGWGAAELAGMAYAQADGPMRVMAGYSHDYSSGSGQTGTTWGLDSASITPTASENRPVNQAVRYLVRARP